MEYRKLGSVQVKGRRAAVGIHEVLGIRGKIPEETLTMAREFEKALDLFVGRKWDEAERAFAALAEQGDPPSKLYVRLCNRYRERAPADGWQGEYVMEKK